MDDDILLEVVMFVGVLCNEGTALMLVESGLVSKGYQALNFAKNRCLVAPPACSSFVAKLGTM